MDAIDPYYLDREEPSRPAEEVLELPHALEAEYHRL